MLIFREVGVFVGGGGGGGVEDNPLSFKYNDKMKFYMYLV